MNPALAANGLRTAFERHSRLARAVRIDTRGRGVELQFSRALNVSQAQNGRDKERG